MDAEKLCTKRPLSEQRKAIKKQGRIYELQDEKK